MGKDDTMKWIAIAFVGVAIAGAIGTAVEQNRKHAESIEAMKHGYVQDKDGNWVKGESK